MPQQPEVHAYLAGPDVFFPNGKEIGEIKKAKLAAVGIIGHYPFDNEISPEILGDLTKTADAIARANEQSMLDCCKKGRIGIILVNMTPFHGPSMDVGTSFEAGFMSALAASRKNVIIIGYTNDPRSFEERVIDSIYGGKKNVSETDGGIYGSDGNIIEAFGQSDNLMITQAIRKTGGSVVNSFEEAVDLAKKLAENLMNG